MFYSHEVLTSRKHGVATVWLVATLGSKSNLKKVTRKAILDVDVAKACETIVAPEAPMALRLQSSLLYGVSRVYLSQVSYVLNDCEAARNNMRALTKMMQQAALEPEGGNKARADQLNLQDDPNFLPDFDLMPLDLDLNNLNANPMINDETQSTLSPHSSQFTGSQQSLGGLMLPPSHSSFVGGPVGGNDLFSVHGDSGRGTRVEAPRILEDDLDFALGEDGGMIMSDAPSQPVTRTQAPVSASGVVLYSEVAPHPGDRIDDDGNMPMQDDFNFSMDDMGGVAGGAAQYRDDMPSEQAAAPSRKRKRRDPMTIPLDEETSLGNRELSRMTKEYLTRMHEALHAKQTNKLATLAKKNAEHWVLGAGTMLGQGMRGPLDIFSGARLLEAFTGINLLNPGQKRTREDDGSSDSGRQKRSRGEPSSEQDEMARGYEGEDYQPIMNDDTIEQGREAPTPLDDRHLSSLFPWNQSAGSRQLGEGHPTSASFGGGPQLNLLNRRGSRLTSASPLVGRGSVIPGIDDPRFHDSDMPMGGLTGDDEFELYGPAAQVDTQTAAQTQWQRAALGAESANFLTFVQTAIDEADIEREDAAPGDEEDEALVGSIDFEDLLPPATNSQIVAAQAFLHVLTLGTKNMLQVEQDEAFGPLNMRLVSA